MSLVSDRPAIAEVIGGVVMVGVSVILGWSLTSRLAAEADPGRVLVLDFLLVLVVLLGLVGVTLIGLAIPVPVVG
ncbi:MAG TPA: hypothetical protein VGA97_08775 [Acidimicrobiia bacterium]